MRLSKKNYWYWDVGLGESEVYYIVHFDEENLYVRKNILFKEQIEKTIKILDNLPWSKTEFDQDWMIVPLTSIKKLCCMDTFAKISIEYGEKEVLILWGRGEGQIYREIYDMMIEKLKPSQYKAEKLPVWHSIDRPAIAIILTSIFGGVLIYLRIIATEPSRLLQIPISWFVIALISIILILSIWLLIRLIFPLKAECAYIDNKHLFFESGFQ